MNKKHIALACSVFGSLLVISMQCNIRVIGFGVWTVSNVIWLYDAVHRKDKEQMYLWTFYLATSSLGFINNII